MQRTFEVERKSRFTCVIKRNLNAWMHYLLPRM